MEVVAGGDAHVGRPMPLHACLLESMLIVQARRLHVLMLVHANATPYVLAIPVPVLRERAVSTRVCPCMSTEIPSQYAVRAWLPPSVRAGLI